MPGPPPPARSLGRRVGFFVVEFLRTVGAAFRAAAFFSAAASGVATLGRPASSLTSTGSALPSTAMASSSMSSAASPRQVFTAASPCSATFS